MKAVLLFLSGMTVVIRTLIGLSPYDTADTPGCPFQADGPLRITTRLSNFGAICLSVCGAAAYPARRD